MIWSRTPVVVAAEGPRVGEVGAVRNPLADGQPGRGVERVSFRAERRRDLDVGARPQRAFEDAVDGIGDRAGEEARRDTAQQLLLGLRCRRWIAQPQVSVHVDLLPEQQRDDIDEWQRRI